MKLVLSAIILTITLSSCDLRFDNANINPTVELINKDESTTESHPSMMIYHYMLVS